MSAIFSPTRSTMHGTGNERPILPASTIPPLSSPIGEGWRSICAARLAAILGSPRRRNGEGSEWIVYPHLSAAEKRRAAEALLRSLFEGKGQRLGEGAKGGGRDPHCP